MGKSYLSKKAVILTSISLFVFETSVFAASLSDFDKELEMGMAKTEVIAAIGSPKESRRWKGRDRWVYFFYQKEGKKVVTLKKETHFKNGLLVYKGDFIKPKVSAEQQDEMNLQEDLSDVKIKEKRSADVKKSREDYEKWVMKVKGNSDDQEAIVPKFQPVK